MEECIICLNKMKNRNKNEHEQSKKHKYFSNVITIKYNVKNNEFYNIKDFIQTNYKNHKKKYNSFSLCVMWKKNDVLVNKISVLSQLHFGKHICLGQA